VSNNVPAYWGNKVFAIPALVLLIAGGVPLTYVLIQSFAIWDAHYPIGWGSVQAYKEILEPHRMVALLRVVQRALIVATVDTIIAAPMSYLLVRKLSANKRRVLMFCLMLPFFTSEVIRAFSWRMILGTNGIMNQVKAWIIPQTEPVEGLLFSEAGVIIVLVAGTLTFAIFPAVLVLSRVPNVLWTVSNEMGATRWTEFFRIALPLSKLGLATGWIITFMFAFNASVEVIVIGGTTQVSVIQMIASLESAGKLADVFALTAILLVLLSLIILAVLLAMRIKRASRLI
jgi:putative spermidine/putrescine transport system permease protein